MYSWYDVLHLDAATFLRSIRKEHFIALDPKGEIRREYERNLKGKTAAGKWLADIIGKNRVIFTRKQLPKTDEDQLINDLGFHNDDLKFVEVAHRTKDKLLATEDSDYTEEVKEYLFSNLKVDVLNIESGLKKVAL